MWLEMSRDEMHGGGEWGFTKCLWSPTTKKGGTSKWAYWENLLRVKAGDTVLHLRGEGKKAAFVGFSIAENNGYKTNDAPGKPGGWAYAKSFYRVNLRDFNPFDKPLFLQDVFLSKRGPLLNYLARNRQSEPKKSLFYVYQAGRLQCL